MVLLQRKLYFSKDPEGVKHFPGGGGPTFSRGVQMLISIETHVTCDFPRGSGPPIPSESAHGTGTSQETGTVYPGYEAT